MDAKYDTVDRSSDEVLPTTTIRKAGMGKKEGRNSPIEGELTHLVGEDTHALDLVPNPRASGLIVLHYSLHVIYLFALQFRNHSYLPPISLIALEKILHVLFGDDKKSSLSNCLSILVY
jgi:hypothetical protein